MKRNKVFRRRLGWTLVFLSFAFLLLNFNFHVFSYGKSPMFMEASAAWWNPVSWFKNSFFLAINFFIYGVWVLISLIMVIAGILLDWAINPDNFAIAVSNNTAIYNAWVIVRDFLNLAFILVLLFSAFCTVFQVEKYHLKKILLTLVIMALLVNFSFPIARFIIDASNVMLYFFVNTLFPGMTNNSGLSTSLGQFVGLAILFDPLEGGKQSILADGMTVKILAAIVFTFIFGATLLIIAILFIIRIVVLGVLIIFSPIGFVGSIIPGMKKFADDWWDALFKQAFFAPIMIFMLYIAVQMMNPTIKTSISNAVQNNTSLDATQKSIIATGATMAMPIVLLWLGLMVSQKFGAVGAAMAQKAGMGAMSKFSGLNAVKRGYKSYRARRQEAQKTGLVTRWGTRLASEQDRLRSLVKVPGRKPGRGARDARNRFEADRLKEVDEAYKSHNMGDMAENELRRIKTDGNADEQAAATRALAEKGTATQSDLDNVRKAFGETSQVFRQLANKVKTYDPVAAFAHLTEPQRQANMIDHMNSNQFDSKKINTHSLGNAEFMELAMGNGSLSVKDINDLRKDASKKDAMEKSLRSILKAGHRNSPASEADRNMHMAHFSVTGEIQDDNFSKHIAENIDDESVKYMNWSKLAPAQQNTITNNVKLNKIRSIAYGIKDNSSARDFVNYLKTTGPHQAYVKGHRDLQNF